MSKWYFGTGRAQEAADTATRDAVEGQPYPYHYLTKVLLVNQRTAVDAAISLAKWGLALGKGKLR